MEDLQLSSELGRNEIIFQLDADTDNPEEVFRLTKDKLYLYGKEIKVDDPVLLQKFHTFFDRAFTIPEKDESFFNVNDRGDEGKTGLLMINTSDLTLRAKVDAVNGGIKELDYSINKRNEQV